MAITPADIQAQTFSEAKRGYDPGEVDVFLEQVSAEVDAMLNKIVDLKNRLTATEQQLADAQNQLAQAQAAPAPAPVPAPAPAAPNYSASERQISASRPWPTAWLATTTSKPSKPRCAVFWRSRSRIFVLGRARPRYASLHAQTYSKGLGSALLNQGLSA